MASKDATMDADRPWNCDILGEDQLTQDKCTVDALNDMCESALVANSKEASRLIERAHVWATLAVACAIRDR